jgi:hypothetical protein
MGRKSREKKLKEKEGFPFLKLKGKQGKQDGCKA